MERASKAPIDGTRTVLQTARPVPAATRTFHLVAVGGTAMTPLAALLLARGERVTGSDGPLYPPMSDRLAALGVRVLPAFSARNVAAEVNEVVAGNVARKDNAEILEAVRRGLRVRSMPETLHDEILPGRHPVVVAGTHGKTTTTALAAWLLAAAGKDPGYLVGGEPVNFPGPAALGTGLPFVIEGDEYSTSYADKGPKFLHYAPRTFVLTSVEFDHADLYADLAAVKAAFRAGVAIVPPEGRIVANADDANVREVLGGARARVVLYGLGPRPAGAVDVDLLATQIAEDADGSRFTVHRSGVEPFAVHSPLAGRHNVANALAAVAVGLEFGLKPADLIRGLASFRGVRRRMEVKGSAAGVTVVDDFAHHPTAVAATIAGARKRFAGRRLWAAFEPRSMTAGRADFFAAYVHALSNADAVALAAPFHGARLSQPGGPGALDAKALVEELRASGLPALTADGPDTLVRALLPELRPGDVVLAMSSGSFGGFPGTLLAALSPEEPSRGVR
jgi:UDP-N-acetylmuramate: L-alanyl-gamma-D-glutamyl-meso-diaminopimelate ligase